MTLEKRLKECLISFTDKITYFPCKGDRPREEYPPYYWWHYKIGRGITNERTDTLYVAVRNKNYIEIVESIYNGLMQEKETFKELSLNEQKLLYQVYNKNIKRIQHLQRFSKW